MNTERKVIISPVPSPSVQGRDKHRFTYLDPQTGQMTQGPIMNKRKAQTTSGRSATDTLTFKIKNGKVQAGLGEKIPNPWYIGRQSDKKEDEINKAKNTVMSSYNLPKSWETRLDILLFAEEIYKQEELEILGGYEPGYYTQQVPAKKGFFWTEEEMSPLMRFKFVFYDRENIITDKDPRQRLALQLIKMRNDKIAPSKNDINTAQHFYYVAEEMEQAKESKRKNDFQNQAVVKLVMLKDSYPLDSDISKWPLYQISTLVKHNNKPLIKGALPPIAVEDHLNEFIKHPRYGGIKACKEFLRVVNLFEKNKERFYIDYLVQQGLNKNLIGLNNGFLFWYSQKDQRAEWYKFSTVEDFATFLFTEFDKYDPEQGLGGAYGEFLQQLKERNAIV